MSEFFDLSDRILNLEQPGKLWSNFGYWAAATDYPDACEALARKLADAVGLGTGQSVLDLGFGMGEQLRLWAQAYSVSQLVGLNPSHSQLGVAQTLSLPPGFVLHAAGAERLAEYVQPASIDVVMALDCAYHFSQRHQVWKQIAKALKPGGLFVWSDLLVPHDVGGWPARAARLAMCRLSQIPSANLLQQATYCQQLSAAGLQLQQLERVTEQVFAPFSQWWVRYRRANQLAAASHLKYQLTASALKYSQQVNCLDYGIFLARKVG